MPSRLLIGNLDETGTPSRLLVRILEETGAPSGLLMRILEETGAPSGLLMRILEEYTQLGAPSYLASFQGFAPRVKGIVLLR